MSPVFLADDDLATVTEPVTDTDEEEVDEEEDEETE